ncbi:MAG: ABC transporter permease [Deltaproteobacteria bacterium]|nr:ABC transporter permease [Deltaproteobacteria bacterium]
MNLKPQLLQISLILGRGITHLLNTIGGLSQLVGEIFAVLFKRSMEFGAVLRQFEFVGVRSFGLVGIISVFTGMVLSLQFIVGLSRFGLEIYTGQIVGVSITRELGPVLTALMIAARAGAGITAELGSMAITEQILAIEAMGADPIQKLVIPRVIATTLCTPLLTVMGDFLGILGGMVVSSVETGTGSQFFLNQITQAVELYDFGSGVGKSFFFGFFIGVIACYQGMNTRGGGAGVGISTTQSVVVAAITIFVSDFFLTKLFLLF